ncbi:homoserine kinase [Pelagibacteraceae bacterium]|nr:homoserine kinase [Pelagibacteraceae bacterium]
MAVFTKLNYNQIENFLSFYSLGKFEDYNEIIEGIENSNYKIICNGKPYILTIFEKRVKEEDLPFFVNLKLYLYNNKFSCPKPIENKDGRIINTILNKKAVIISFIEGNKIEIPTISECIEIGKMIGQLHTLTMKFDQKRQNSLDIDEWKRLFQKCESKKTKEFDKLSKELKDEIDLIEKSWPKNLPSGIVHADLFKDNIFFDNEKITGVIDFYFSCYHFFIYDIAIVINDWCFDKSGSIFKKNFFNAIYDGYNSIRKIEDSELSAFNLILRAATVRILITRLHDYIFHPSDALVVKKDPIQYYNILKWHQQNNIH